MTLTDREEFTKCVEVQIIIIIIIIKHTHIYNVGDTIISGTAAPDLP